MVIGITKLCVVKLNYVSIKITIIFLFFVIEKLLNFQTFLLLPSGYAPLSAILDWSSIRAMLNGDPYSF